MDFKQIKKPNYNQEKFHIENLKIVREFSKKLLIETDELVRSIVIFGSNNTNTLKKNSDIDVMVILDNISVFVSDELREAYKIITSKLIKASQTQGVSDGSGQEISKKFLSYEEQDSSQIVSKKNSSKSKNKIHLLSINLSDFWDMARKGDPVFINILRTGSPIFDRDLVEPMQYLLEIGKIRPTKEAVNNYIARSEILFNEVDKKIFEGVLDLYYSLIDMVHATLMIHKIIPPSPKDMPKIFKSEFKNNKKIIKFSKEIDEIYKLAKKIEHNEINKISGNEFDKIKKTVEKIIFELKRYNEEKMKNMDTFDL